MKKVFRRLAYMLLLVVVAGVGVASADPGPIGLKIGGGTDFKGIAGGGGFSYMFATPGAPVAWEMGVDFFYHNSTDSGTSSDHYDWEETTTLLVGLLKFNSVFGYKPGKASGYFIAGSGIVVASVDWQETGDGTAGYGYLSPYTYEYEGVGFGTVLNLGVGYSFGTGLELRLEAPMLVFFGDYGATAFVPTVTGNLIYRFPE